MSDRRNGSDRRDEVAPRGEERRMGDRRESHRVPIEVEVCEGNNPYELHHGNVGIGGMFFKKPLAIPTGATIQLRFTLPSHDQMIEVKGEIVEITAVGVPEDRGTRVRFIDLELKAELLIAKYLDEHIQE